MCENITKCFISTHQCDGLVGVAVEMEDHADPSSSGGSVETPRPKFLPLEHVDFQDNHVYYGVSSAGPVPEV